MSRLHIVSKAPPASDSLSRCLAFADDGDALLLIEDAATAALAGGAGQPLLFGAKGAGIALYVLAPDLERLGLGGQMLAAGVGAVDHGGFVELVARHALAQSWT